MTLDVREERPGLSLALLRPMTRGLAKYGVTPEEFFAMVGLPDVANRPEATGRASIYRVASVIDVIARKQKVDYIGFDIARAMPVGTLGTPDYVWSASATLLHAMMRSQASVEDFTDGINIELQPEGEQARLVLAPKVHDHPVFLNELTLVILVSRMRHVLGEGIPLLRVRFKHKATAPTEGFDEFFGVKVEFNAGEDSFTFPMALLHSPLATADPELVRLLRANKKTPKKGPDTADPLLDRARALIVSSLQEGKPDLDVAALAERLEVSTRSLQRRLGERKTSFSDLLDDARRDLATTLLEKEGVLLADVAERLGFSSLTAFHRAFRRWTGASPRSFQRQRM